MKMQSHCMTVIQLICVFQVNISLFILHGLWVVPLPQPLFFFQFLLQPLLPAQLLQRQPIQVRAPLPVWPFVCVCICFVFQLVWRPLMLIQFWLSFLLLMDWSLSAHRWCALSWSKRDVHLIASVEMQLSMWNCLPPPSTLPFLIFLFQLVLLRVR